ncbi:MAG TPA: tol-pal system protein YbgF [Alphaproteobacteria bacterium]|nr:tol-pal system protein YbgF [Alphaproteobacteria bacterium]
MKQRFFASWIRRIACSLAVLVSLAVPAAAQTDTRSLVDQIDRLRRDVDVLQRQLARGGPPPAAGPTAVGSGAGVPVTFIEQTDARFADLDTQLRDLTGRVEELNYSVRQLTERLDKLVGDVDFRLSALERGGASAPAGGMPPPTAAAPPPAGRTPSSSEAQVPSGQARMVLVPGPTGAAPAPGAAPPAQSAAVTLPAGSPEAQYEFAYAQLLQAQREQGDFGRAEAALKAFVAANPNHRLAGNAQYWLGETYYVRRDYQNAAIAFAEGFQKYPNSEKAPDNLLKLGMTMGQLNQKPKACGTLGELERRYPQASSSIKQATQREKQRLGCG